MDSLKTQPHIADDEFITQFEAMTLDPSNFDHIGHIRLAYLYLAKYLDKYPKKSALHEAIQCISSGIQRYATSLGARDKFHVTITDAITRVIAQRMQLSESNDWQTFLLENKDLVDDALSILHQYYSKDLLFSQMAKEQLLPPDLQSW